MENLTLDDYGMLDRCARHPQVLAIGETGMDRLRGPDLEVQQLAFVRHLRLAQVLNKPVVAHCVRTAQDILAARHREGLDHVTLVIHGMRGNEHVARTLLDAGCYLSFGISYNIAALQATPISRLLIESDVADAVSRALDITTGALINHVTATARLLLMG